MKQILPLLLLVCLAAAPDASFSAASDAALLWWTRVLPSLLPYLIAVSLLERSDLFFRLPKRIALLLLLPLGAIGGYPAGAKLAGRLYGDGALTLRNARRAALAASLPNPVFLYSVVAVGTFHDPCAAIPLLIGIYGPALFGAIPMLRVSLQTVPLPGGAFSAQALPDAIRDGVRSILMIGGCLVFAAVLGALIGASGLLSLFGTYAAFARAILLGVCEMTCGVQAAAALSLPVAVRLALCAFFAQFGGVSVGLQCASHLPVSFSRWFAVRFVTGAIAAIAVYLLSLALVPEPVASVFASKDAIVRNAADLASVALASGFGLLLIFVFTAGSKKRKKTP